MLTPAPMQRVTLQLLTDKAQEAALVLAGCGVFNPETTTQALASQLPETPGERYRELYRAAQSRLDKILAHCTISDEELGVTAVRDVSETELAELDDWLQQVWAKCSECQEGVRRVQEGQKRIDQLIKTLDTFASLDIDLGLLQRDKQFLDVRIGTLHADNVPRLRDALAIAGYLLSDFMVSYGVTHAIIAGPTGREREVDTVLQAAGWHALEIPPEFQDRPENVREELSKRRAQVVD